ncbi:uncharacterized protein LOC142570966 isoform X2 [Dermacentor variabilis]|uniref:uncharacterized protein LOC142570966 isoform X2 n=1 Tax=Dermacentor variabilis TaxID=34621 RepID=UPI003F5C5013
MQSLFSYVLLLISALLLEVPFASGKAKHQLKHDVTDAFKTFEVFPYAITAFDSDDDGDLDCAMVVRQQLDENQKTATYVLVLPPVNGRQPENHTYYLKEGSTTDKPVFTVDDGCGLWVTKDVLHSFPQECIDQFEDNCDNAVAVFDDDTCKGVFDNI